MEQTLRGRTFLWMITTITAVMILGVLVCGANAQDQPLDWVWPLSASVSPDRIASPFGPRPRPVTRYEFHEGIDLPSDLGSAVHAVAPGTISLLTDDRGCRITRANETAVACSAPLYPGGGRIVQLRHDGARYTNYFHLSYQADGLTTGNTVTPGMKIGEVGHTGNASYPHLHFEVRAGGNGHEQAVNPLSYLPRPDNQPPSIQTVRRSTAAPCLSGGPRPATQDIAVRVTTTAADYDLNAIVLRIRSRDGEQLDERRVAFDQRVNVGSPDPETGGICVQSEDIDDTGDYHITVIFRDVALFPSSAVEVQATDTSGLSDTWAGNQIPD